MFATKSWRWVALAVGAGTLLSGALYPTDEKRVREAAEALATAAHGSAAAMSRALEQYATANVSVSVAELPEPLTGRGAMLAALEQLERFGQKPRFRIEAVEVSVEGNRARLTADLVTMPEAEVPELRRPRHGVALFEKHAGRFRLVSAELGAERRDQPEARP